MPNETLIHADIFFFISTIALVLVGAGIVIALVYAIKILKNIKYISDRVRDISDKIKEESVEIMADVKTLRKNLRDEGLKWKGVIDLIRNFLMIKGAKTKKTTKKTTDTKKETVNKVKNKK